MIRRRVLDLLLAAAFFDGTNMTHMGQITIYIYRYVDNLQ